MKMIDFDRDLKPIRKNQFESVVIHEIIQKIFYEIPLRYDSLLIGFQDIFQYF